MEEKNNEKKRKVMIVASVASMIDQFNRENIKILQGLNYEVHVATNFDAPGNINVKRNEKLMNDLVEQDIIIHNIPFSRKPKSVFNHIKCYMVLKQIVIENNIDMLHCHSPIVSVIVRLIGKKLNKKIIYTAHGFHFFKNAPLKNWLMYYPIEKYFSKYTDILITINKEDYNLSEKKFKAKDTRYIPSIGLDVEQINKKLSKKVERKELSFPEEATILISVGELNKNKNHKVVIQSLAELKNDELYYVICGIGSDSCKQELMNLIREKSLENQVALLGYKENVVDYLANSDVFIFPSIREGLGMAALEAMAVGLPVLNSYVGGLKDFTKDGITGFTFENPHNKSEVMHTILEFLNLDDSKKMEISKNNKEIAVRFDKNITNSIMKEIYQYI